MKTSKAIIPVNEKYRIVLDFYSWQIDELKIPESGKHKGEKIWTAMSWHRTLSDAAEALQRHYLVEEGVEGIQKVIVALRDSQAALERAIAQSGHENSWADEKRRISALE